MNTFFIPYTCPPIYRHLPSVQAPKPVFHCNRRYHASPSLGRHVSDLPVIPDSLKETLEAHRNANRRRVIRLIPSNSPHDDRKFGPGGLGPNTRELKPLRRSTPLTKLLPPLTSPELNIEKLYLPSKKVRLNIRANGAVALLRRLAKKKSARWNVKPIVSVDEVQCPWLDYLEPSGFDALSRLADEIRSFDSCMSQIPQEEVAVNAVIAEVEEILQRENHPQPLLIGSRQVGLALRHSNIDLLLRIPDPDGHSEYRGPSPTRPKVAELQLGRQEQIARLLRGTTAFSSVNLIRSRTPVVTALHDATGLPVTLHSGTQMPASLEFVQSYNSEFPTLRPLLVVLRMILEQRNLFGPQNRSFDTYTLTMMIVAALKLSEGKYSRTNPAEQLLLVLKLYSTVSFRRYGISVEPPSMFRKRGHLREPTRQIEPEAPYVRGQISIGKTSAKLRSHMLCLQDPANYMNDIGMGCFRILEIQQLFGDVYSNLEAAMKTWDDSSGKPTEKQNHTGPVTEQKIQNSSDRTTDSLLRFALGGNYDRLERIRDKIVLGSGG